MENKVKKLQNKDAEKNIIAELVSNDQALANIQNLQPKHFASNKLQKIFTKILEISQDNRPVDIVTLSNELEGVSVSDLTYFIGQSISAVKVKEYENIIIENWVKRQLFKTGYNFINKISKPENKPADLVSSLSSECDRVLQTNEKLEDLGSIEKALNNLIEYRVDGIRKSEGIKTGYPKIDYKTGGLQKGDFVVIGADTSVGKTALALNIIENIMFSNNPRSIGYVSLELTKEDEGGLLDRLTLAKAGISINKFRNNQATPQEKTRYQNIATQINSKPLKIIDNISTLPEILTNINLLHKKFKSRLVIIDNLQNINPPSEKNLRIFINEITSKFKAIAKRLGITIVALSHLSRSGDSDKPPRLSDLKESSSIEQDSDKVLLIHRPYIKAMLSDYKEDCTLYLAKNRQGHTGKIDLVFNRKLARFEN